MSVREIPMLFQRPMVLALLAGRKTQTRRFSFKGKPGDLIWVRESWRTYVSLDLTKPVDLWSPEEERGAAFFYEAGGGMFISRGVGDRTWGQDDERLPEGAGKRRSSLHLPRWGSRLTLRVTDVREEPLASISEADAIAEGILPVESNRWPAPQWTIYLPDGRHTTTPDPRFSYETLWRAIHGEDSWRENPTVKVVSFDVMREAICSVTGRA